jgi:nucleotide-binding universal stress UspA family protein
VPIQEAKKWFGGSPSFMVTNTNLVITRILCAVTLSPSARHVVEWAASLAEACHAELRLFHVLPNTEDVAVFAPEADAEGALAKLFALARHVPGRTRISAAVAHGDAAGEILRHARLVHADVIAIGMQAGDETETSVVGTVAIGAPCPLLVVGRAEGGVSPRPAPRRLLCAVNFSAASLAGADYASRLARGLGAQVTFAHVLPDHWEELERHDPSLRTRQQALEHRVRRLLEDTIREMSGPLGESSVVAVSGCPCVEIVRLSRTGDADLIVMGMDADHESWDALRQTTSCVIHFARAPVLLVPERLFRTPRVSG